MHLLRRFLAALLLACAVTPAFGQTIKTLGYNTTNDTVVQTQRITFTRIGVASGTAATPSLTYASGTNTFGTFASTQLGVGPYLGFSVDGTRRFYISTNTIRAELPISFATTTNAAETRTNLSLGATWLTNADVTNFRTAVGLGATNDVSFNSVAVTNATTTRANLGFSTNLNTLWTATNAADAREAIGLSLGANQLYVDNIVLAGTNGLAFDEPDAAATTRTNLFMPLAALTNTSNVTMMRALAGSTNTNHPYNGTVYLSNVISVTISNGIIVDIEEP